MTVPKNVEGGSGRQLVGRLSVVGRAQVQGLDFLLRAGGEQMTPSASQFGG